MLESLVVIALKPLSMDESDDNGGFATHSVDVLMKDVVEVAEVSDITMDNYFDNGLLVLEALFHFVLGPVCQI